MKTFRIRTILILLAAIVCLGVICLPSTVLAETKYSLGAGVGAAPDYEGSEDMAGVPALFFSAMWDEGYFIKLAGPAIRANVIPSKTWSLGPVLQYRATRDDDVDNNVVAKMKKVDSTAEGGLFVGFNQAGWDTSLQYVTDTSDKHEGSLVTLIAGYTFKEDRYATRIGMSSTYADDDYMDTYFSVNAANVGGSGLESSPTYPYKAEAEVKDVGADVMVRYHMNENWDLMGLLAYKVLLGDASDSPVVDIEGSSGQTSAAIMAIYNF